MAKLFFVALILLLISVVKSQCLCTKLGSHSVCVEGSDTECECIPGYEPIDQLNCKDTNECTEGTHNCVQTCSNNPGGFECSCNKKFQGDGTRDGTGCTDLDECATQTECKGGTCVNIVANKTSDRGYLCNCFAGYATFLQQYCIAQKCSFEPTNMSARGHLGTCKDVFNKTGDGKVHLVFDETRKCQFGCQPGYTRIDGTYTCGPNNPNGETTGLKVGVVEGSPVKCVEQQCTVEEADLVPGSNSRLGSCVGRLNALQGKQSCELTCADGFAKTAGGVISCGPNGDKPEGKLSGNITCEPTSCGALVVPYSNHKDGHHKNSITYDTVNVICDHGYVGGQSTAVCSPDGLGQSKWTQYKACQAASCGALTIENSNHGDGNHIGVTGDTADVTCADGYIGPKTIVTCTADVSAAGVSFWSPMPTCAAATCPPLTVANGKASSDSPSKTMETVDITCDDGYIQLGTSATCSPSGPGKAAWTNIPICTAAPCALERIPNSDKIDGIEGMVGDTMEVNCVEASNPFQLKCVANGPGKARWDDYSPCNAPSVTASMAESPVIGVAVGVSVGAVVLLVLIIAVVAFLCRGKDKSERQTPAPESPAADKETSPCTPTEGGASFETVEKQFENEMLAPQSVVLGPRLAIGGHASIFRGTFGSMEVALKEDSYHGYEGLDEDTIQETRIMLKTRHPYIVTFYGLWISPQSSRLFMVMEFCRNGDLGIYVSKHENISKQTKYTWAVQVSNALIYLHERTIIHRDLKPGNILLDVNLVAKLADFGIAREVTETRDLTIQVGTVAFMPPEAMDVSDDEDDLENGQSNNVDGKKWDVYSLSIVFAYVFTGKEVYPGLTNPRIFRGVPKGKRPDTTGVDEGMVNLMKRMWTKRHSQRPTMVEVLEAVKKVQAAECGGESTNAIEDDGHNGDSSSSSDEAAGAKSSDESKRVEGDSSDGHAESGEI